MTCQLTVMNLATTGSCRSDVKGDVELPVFGVGTGEGLAAVRGHQSGVKGRELRCPRSHWEIEAIGSYDPASRNRLRFHFGHAGRVPLPA